MDFTPTAEQRAARDLAAEIFGDLSTHERLSALGSGVDGELWKALCAAGLPAAVEEIGLVGLVLLLEEQGRVTAQVPLAASCAYGLLPVAFHGTVEQRARLLPALRDGTAVATAACGAGPRPGASARRSAEGWVLTGTFPVVPWLRAATHVLVPALTAEGRTRCFLVECQAASAPATPGPTDSAPTPCAPTDSAPTPCAPTASAPTASAPTASAPTPCAPTASAPTASAPTAPAPVAPATAAAITHAPATSAVQIPGTPVRTEPVETTAPWAAGRLTLHDAPAEPLGDDGVWADVLGRARTAFAGLQAGVCQGSLAQVVHHTSIREQFGRPLSAFQGVLLRAADAHMDTEAIRVTAYEAAWRHDQRLPAATHALTTAWWACEAGRRVVHAGQHLHGGIGADVEHPVHRHFLWGRQLDAYLGPAPALLAELGTLLTEETAA